MKVWVISRTRCPKALHLLFRTGDMESRHRHRTKLTENGDVTPPAPSSEAEDGYDTSTATDSSKVCYLLLSPFVRCKPLAYCTI